MIATDETGLEAWKGPIHKLPRDPRVPPIGGSMGKVPEIVPVTDLRQDAAAVIRRLQGSREPMVITQRGRAAAVLLSMESYEKTRNELELLRLLARGERDIAKGAGRTLESVLRDTDRILRED